MNRFEQILKAVKREQKGKAKKTLATIYTETLRELTELEREYNEALITQLDFESRKAMDKQEMEILNNNPELRAKKDRISELKAILRACSFSMEALK